MNQQLSLEQLEWMVGLIRYWSGLIPAVKTLVVMIGLDIASGWMLAIAKCKLNSTTSFAGMMKKTMVLLLVAVAIVLEPYANGLPLSMLVALGFIAQEGLSIMENAAALGIWMPQPLIDVLEKLQKGKKERLSQKTGTDAALDRNTAAVNRRADQQDSPQVIPVVVINAPENPVPVTKADP